MNVMYFTQKGQAFHELCIKVDWQRLMFVVKNTEKFRRWYSLIETNATERGCRAGFLALLFVKERV